MRTLIDTSCMVSVLCSWHEHHEFTRAEVERSGRGGTLLVAAPSLIETYAVLTRLPTPHRISAQDAWTLLDANWGEGDVIALTATEYWRVLRDCQTEGVTGGPAYDAVIAACARKARVDRILTWNEKHFIRYQGSFAVEVPKRT